jgi:LPS sulfotransferase NodH
MLTESGMILNTNSHHDRLTNQSNLVQLHLHCESLLKQTMSFTDARLEDFMHQAFDGKKKERQTNYELLGQCMFDAGNELGPGTAYG